MEPVTTFDFLEVMLCCVSHNKQLANLSVSIAVSQLLCPEMFRLRPSSLAVAALILGLNAVSGDDNLKDALISLMPDSDSAEVAIALQETNATGR